MEIGAKYPMSVENYGYYLGSSYGMNFMGSLHKREGIMGVEMRERDAWSGTVFRDLNNLATAKLITRVAEGRKRVYSTNMETLRSLTRRILQVVNPDEPEP